MCFAHLMVTACSISVFQIKVCACVCVGMLAEGVVHDSKVVPLSYRKRKKKEEERGEWSVCVCVYGVCVCDVVM